MDFLSKVINKYIIILKWCHEFCEDGNEVICVCVCVCVWVTGLRFCESMFIHHTMVMIVLHFVLVIFIRLIQVPAYLFSICWVFYIQIVISSVLNKGNVWSAGSPKVIYPLCRLTYTLGSKQERYLQLQWWKYQEIQGSLFISYVSWVQASIITKHSPLKPYNKDSGCKTFL